MGALHLPESKKNAKNEGAVIVFEDEAVSSSGLASESRGRKRLRRALPQSACPCNNEQEQKDEKSRRTILHTRGPRAWTGMIVVPGDSEEQARNPAQTIVTLCPKWWAATINKDPPMAKTSGQLQIAETRFQPILIHEVSTAKVRRGRRKQLFAPGRSV